MATKTYMTQNHFEIVLNSVQHFFVSFSYCAISAYTEVPLGGGPELTIMNHSNLPKKSEVAKYVSSWMWRFLGHRGAEIGVYPRGNIGDTTLPVRGYCNYSMAVGIAAASMVMLFSMKRREPGMQAPGQCFRAHSIAKFRFRQ
jgi:hypothetical protein